MIEKSRQPPSGSLGWSPPGHRRTDGPLLPCPDILWRKQEPATSSDPESAGWPENLQATSRRSPEMEDLGLEN